MLNVVYQNNEALRCADQQDLAKDQLTKTAHLTNGLNNDLRATWGTCASAIIDDIHRAQQARSQAIARMETLCEQQAKLCRTADTAYHNTDEQAAENLDQQL